MRENIIKNQEAYSLMEIVVSIGIFAVLMVAVLNIFHGINEGQRNAISAQNVQSSVRYIMEIISKEMRSAKRSDTQCTAIGDPNQVYRTPAGNDMLYFKNKNRKCVRYYLNAGVLMREIGDDLFANSYSQALTPSELTVSNLTFAIDDNYTSVDPEDKIQPSVTISFSAEWGGSARYSNPIFIQTTVSSRYY